MYLRNEKTENWAGDGQTMKKAVIFKQSIAPGTSLWSRRVQRSSEPKPKKLMTSFFWFLFLTSRLQCENLKRNMISDCKYDQRWITCKIFPPIGLVFNHSKSSVQTVDVSCFLICLNTAEMKHFILDQSPKLKNKANTQPPNTAVPLMSSRGSSELIPIDCHVKTLQLK